jgi:hypothetical protein
MTQPCEERMSNAVATSDNICDKKCHVRWNFCVLTYKCFKHDVILNVIWRLYWLSTIVTTLRIAVKCPVLICVS